MERRAILVVLLSVGVLMIYQLWFMPYPARRPGIEKIDRKKEKIEVKKVDAHVAKVTQELPEEVKREHVYSDSGIVCREEVARITSEKYDLLLTNRGAIFRAIKLKNFHKSVDGEDLVDLVEFFDSKSCGGPIVFLPGHKLLEERVNRAFYRLSRNSLTLDSRHPKGVITCVYEDPAGFRVEKTYTFVNDSYFIGARVEISVRNNANNVGWVMGDFGVAWSFGSNLLLENKHIGSAGPVLCVDDKVKEIKVSKMDTEYIAEGDTGWLAYQIPYFAMALVPKDTDKVRIGIYKRPLKRVDLVIYSQDKKEDFYIYAGPKIEKELKVVDKGLVRLVNYGWFGWLARPLLKLLNFFYLISGNYGLSIIMLTLLIQVLFFPLTYKSFKSMKGMQELQPKMAILKERYKDDPKKLNAEVMALYREHKVNPLGGCLPLVFQIPVFFALYKVLLSSIVLRHAPFILWVKDLSAPDTVGHLPGIGISLNILPILMGITMFIQQKISPTTADARQAKIMAYFMPIFMTAIFWRFPSGLVLYWLANNVITVTEQYFIKRGL